jgi:hypothetical protein
MVISDRTHVSDLPPPWGMLYELIKPPEGLLRTTLKDGTIKPEDGASKNRLDTTSFATAGTWAESPLR